MVIGQFRRQTFPVITPLVAKGPSSVRSTRSLSFLYQLSPSVSEDKRSLVEYFLISILIFLLLVSVFCETTLY